jgi:hypothetical protein
MGCVTCSVLISRLLLRDAPEVFATMWTWGKDDSMTEEEGYNFIMVKATTTYITMKATTT